MKEYISTQTEFVYFGQENDIWAWYFYDEAAYVHGPFILEWQALHAFNTYCDFLNNGDI